MTAGATGWRFWLLLGLLWCATLPLRPLLDPDEGRYAEIPREMVASGDWVTPRLNGLKYFEKPALQYWATAAFYELFGTSAWASRLWGTGLAFLALPLVYGFARRLGRPPAEALVAACVLAINPYYGLLAHVNLLDQAFSTLLCAAMFCFVLAQCEGRAPGHDASAPGHGGPASHRERAWMLAAWAGLALAVLSKGIVAIVLTGGALALYMIAERDFGVLKRMHFAAGLALFLAIAAPWFMVVQLRNPEFAGFFFVHEHFARFLTKVHRRTGRWYFLPILLLALLPFLGAVREALRQAWRAPAAPGGFRAQRFLLWWCVATVGFYSVSQSKLPPYVMPVMPALAVLLAAPLLEGARALRRAADAQCVLLLVLAFGLAGFDRQRHGHSDPELLGWCALAVLAALAPELLAIWRARRDWLPLAVAAIVAWQALLMAYSELPPVRTTRELAAVVAPQLGPRTELFTVSQYRHSASFYLARPLRVVDYVGELEFGLGREDRGQLADLDAFRAVWQESTDAIAFIEPATYERLRAAGLPAQPIAVDERSVVVRRRP
ncbi:MAG: phospholipid carrier-dependent glycosyltransferase [Steroidobacteraceae bacterium]